MKGALRVRAIRLGSYNGAPVWPGCTFTLTDPAHFDAHWMAEDVSELRPPRPAPTDRPPATETPEQALERSRAEHLRMLRRIERGLKP